MRPLLSPDGTQLVYATRHETQTGLRIRDLNTGADRWLAWPVQRDEQESRFTRDLFPGYAFTPDGRSVVYTRDGGIWRVDVASGETARIPFELEVEQSLGPELRAPRRLGLGPVKARLVRGLAPAPDGGALAFSALGALYVHDRDGGGNRAVVEGGPPAAHPPGPRTAGGSRTPPGPAPAATSGERGPTVGARRAGSPNTRRSTATRPGRRTASASSRCVARDTTGCTASGTPGRRSGRT